MPHCVVYCVPHHLHFTVTLYCILSLCIATPLSFLSHSSGSWSSAGGGAGSVRSAGAGVVGGPGGSSDVLSCGSPAMRWLAEALTGQDNRSSLAQNVVGLGGAASGLGGGPLGRVGA